MLLGNLTSILLTVVALLQALSWTIAGLLILATLSITTLLPLGNAPDGASRLQTKKPSNHLGLSESKYPRERTQDKQITKPHQVPERPEQKPLSKHEPSKSPSQLKSDFQKAMIPKITPPNTIPGVVRNSNSIQAKHNPPNQAMLKPIPPKAALAILGPPTPVPSEPVLGKPTVIEKGDYVSFDVQLDQGKSITCDVTANGRVNFYILDDDNLTSLDLGEEFWSETGEEGVENVKLEFTPPSKGKWFFVVENADDRAVSVTVKIQKGTASPVPA